MPGRRHHNDKPIDQATTGEIIGPMIAFLIVCGILSVGITVCICQNPTTIGFVFLPFMLGGRLRLS